MPINQRNADNRDGFKCIPWTAINKDASAVVYTPFYRIYAAIHVDTSANVVYGACAVDGSTSLSMNVAAAGNMLVWGDGSGAAAITLT